MVDEAHRTQEGDYGRKMREALPNAFLFGLTGTPINRRDRNTFMWFGSPEDEGGYLSRYTMRDSIRDGATLPLHFEPRLSRRSTSTRTPSTPPSRNSPPSTTSRSATRSRCRRRRRPSRRSSRPEDRVRQIAADIAEHFTTKVDPQGFKAQVVVYDKPTCVAYKAELDKYLPAEASTIVMSKSRDDPPEWAQWTPGRDELETITARFNDPADPLKIIIVTAKLLTGFDAPILYAQYLDKPLKEHTLLQAITRTNRVYPPSKTHGLVVDYLGVFDNVAKAFKFDEGVGQADHHQHRGAQGSARACDRDRSWRSFPAWTAPSAATRASSRPKPRSPTTTGKTPSASPTAWCPSSGRRSAPTRCCRRTRPTTGG